MATLQEQHYGIVSNNDDPEKRGRLKVTSQSLTGAGMELPSWLEPDNPFFSSIGGFGSVFIPAVGSTVELVVDVHDTDLDDMPFERFLDNPTIRWKPRTFTAEGGANPLPAELSLHYPERRGFKTISGHYLVLDDTKGAESVLIVHKNAGTFISMDQDGSILVMTKKGQMVFLDDRDGSQGVKLIDQYGNSVTLDTNGIKAIDKSSNLIVMQGGVAPKIQITAQSQLILNAPAVNLNAGAIDLGSGAVDYLVKGTALASAWATISSVLSAVPPAVDLPTVITLANANKTAILGMISTLAAALSANTRTL